MKGNKILIIVCGLLLTTFVLTKMLGDDIKVTSLMKQQYEKKEADVIEGEGFVKYTSDISDIKDVTWINEDVVCFNGTSEDENETRSFKLDLSTKEIYEGEESVEAFYHEEFKDDIKYVMELVEGKHLVYAEGKERKGLFYVRKDANPILLADNISFNSDMLFKISDNKEKVAYYDADEKKLKVYGFSTNKTVDIDEEVDDELLKNFQNNIDFSYEAGYLTVERVNRNDFKESYFAVYGADSGKVYAENLLGINPVWSKDSLVIAFAYLEDNSVVNTKDVKVDNLVGDRVGFFNLKTRGIRYTQTMDKGFKIIKPVVWKSKNEVIFFVGKYSKEDNKYFFNNIYSFNSKNNILTDLKGSFEDINNLGDDFENQLSENLIYVYSNYNEESKAIKVINIENRSMKEISEVQDFVSNSEGHEGRVLFKPLDSNTFLYIQNDCIYKTDLNDNYLKYRSDSAIAEVYESPDKTKIFLVCEGESALEFVIIDNTNQ